MNWLTSAAIATTLGYGFVLQARKLIQGSYFTHTCRTLPANVRGLRVLITGANRGLGYALARELAQRGATITLACRSNRNADATIEQLVSDLGPAVREQLSTVVVDMSSFDSVRAAAADFCKRAEPLDVLVNNAGIAGSSDYTVPEMTRDGHERIWQINFLGPHLFTRLLDSALRDGAYQTGQSRVIYVSSGMHERASIGWLHESTPPDTSFSSIAAYGQSKLAQIMAARHLSREMDAHSVISLACTPGATYTDIVTSFVANRWYLVPLKPLIWLIMRSPQQGVQVLLHCIGARTAPEPARDTVTAGGYYSNCRPRDIHGKGDIGLDDDACRRLVELADEAVGFTSDRPT